MCLFQELLIELTGAPVCSFFRFVHHPIEICCVPVVFDANDVGSIISYHPGPGDKLGLVRFQFVAETHQMMCAFFIILPSLLILLAYMLVYIPLRTRRDRRLQELEIEQREYELRRMKNRP